MSEKRTRSLGREYNMAFRDVPSTFKNDFIQDAQRVLDAKDRRSKVPALALLLLDLNIYTGFYKISNDDINAKRREKADKKGTFTRSFILKWGHGEKLVRDGIPKLHPENKYRRASGKELLRFFDLKVVEESIELIKSTPSNRLEEVADLKEAIDALINGNDIKEEEFMTIVQSVEDSPKTKQPELRRKLASKSK